MKLLYTYKEKGMWWARMRNGRGICWKNLEICPLTYTERTRHSENCYKFFNWMFIILKNNKKI